MMRKEDDIAMSNVNKVNNADTRRVKASFSESDVTIWCSNSLSSISRNQEKGDTS